MVFITDFLFACEYVGVSTYEAAVWVAMLLINNIFSGADCHKSYGLTVHLLTEVNVCKERDGLLV